MKHQMKKKLTRMTKLYTRTQITPNTTGYNQI